MIRTAWKSALYLVLAACGTALPKGEIEPIRKVLSDNRSLPFECVNYDAASDSCGSIVSRRISGDRIFYEATALLPGPGVDLVRVKMNVDFKIEGSRYCGNMRNADLRLEGKLSPGQRSLMQELVLADLISMGDVCGVYYREGGGYVSVTTDRAGRVVPHGVESVHFFKRPKKLRL